MLRLSVFIVSTLASAASFAGTPPPTTPVPLPGVLGLLAAGGIGALVVHLRNKRK